MAKQATPMKKTRAHYSDAFLEEALVWRVEHRTTLK